MAALGLTAAPSAVAAVPHLDPHPLKPRPHGAAAAAVIPGPLINHGGPVQSAPRVYVDFWGWTSDPSGEQPYLQNFLSSVGGTPWLATVDQYGGGSGVNLLAGTWSDPAGIPSVPSDGQIQAEAASAAAHFGTGNSANVEIVVATPTRHSTAGFGSQYCAYHGAVAAAPNITYTDLPYMADAGANCGQGVVNGAGGTLDGVSIVEGHELAETITDPLLNAWIDAGGNEIGDKCAWTGLSNLSTAGGTFAVQPLWSNAANGCVLATGGGGSPSPNLLTSGSFERSTTGWQTIMPSGGVTNVVNYNTANGAPAIAQDGTGYLAFNTNGQGGSVFQDVAVNAPAGSSYVASAWLSSQSGSASGIFCVFGLGSSVTNTCRGYTVSAGTYTDLQIVFDTTQATSTLRFQIYPTPDGGTTDMDTASLVRSMLTSGSFEGSTTGWQTITPSGGVTNVVDYNTANGAPAIAQDGTGYLAFNTNGQGGSLFQDVAVNAPAASSYVASVWLSSQSGSASGRFCVFGLGLGVASTCRGYTVSAGTYTDLQIVFDTTQANTRLRFQIYPTPDGGTTDMDTASLVNSMLTSGSFEGSTTGWQTITPSGGVTNIANYNTANGAPAIAQDGTGYLAFNTNGPGGSVFQDVTVNAAAGNSYVASAWLSSQSGSASGIFCVFGLGSSVTNTCRGYTVNAGTYTDLQIVFDTTQATSTLRFQIYPTPNGGTTDMDTAGVS